MALLASQLLWRAPTLDVQTKGATAVTGSMSGDAHMATDLAADISAVTGWRLASAPESTVSGGNIGTCLCWMSALGPLFVKLAEAGRAWILEAEADGLRALAAAGEIRVPSVLGAGVAANRAWLALEWLDLRPASAASEAELGKRLAQQHRHASDTFGWHRANTIGLTPQSNEPATDWARFYVERRLAPQLDLAVANGHGGHWLERGRGLCERVPDLLAGHSPLPSLLHGDLWAGNHAEVEPGYPVIFDPSTYYGDREADLAMTRLFGGYGRSFYAAYESAWPLPPGAAARAPLYNLYHVLNHLNLFGDGYRRQAAEMIEGLLATVV